MKSFSRQRRSSQSVTRRGLLRRLLSETLERREMFAADLWGHHNPAINTDVNSDYDVTPLDA